jgi:inner membrane transporter RhtA
MLCVQLGAAVAVPVMVRHGSFGITAERLVCAALVMLVLVRPNFASFNRRQWLAAMALGTTMALMTMSYFEAVTRSRSARPSPSIFSAPSRSRWSP